MAVARMPSDWPYRDRSRHIRCRPHVWHVQDIGAGPVILMIHGAGGATHSWRALVPLMQGFRLILPDLPGQGFSRAGAKMRLGLEPMAEDLAALLAAEGLAPAAIVGHSAGAAVALALADRLPTPPRAVIGINAALGAFEGVQGWLFPALARLLALNPLVPRLFARLSGTDGRVRALIGSTGSTLDPAGIGFYRALVQDPDHVDGTLSMMAQWRLEALMARLPDIAVPTLLIAAEGDRTVPADVSARAAARLGDGQLLRIPGYGHLIHEEAPEAVAGPIQRFLSDRGVSPRV